MNASLIIQKQLIQSLFQAMDFGNLEQVRTLLTHPDTLQRVDIFYTIPSMNTNLLMEACLRGQINIVQYLLTSNEIPRIDIHARDSLNHSAFLLACYRGHYDIAQYLLTSKELHENSNINDVTIDKKNVLDLLKMDSLDEEKVTRVMIVMNSFIIMCWNLSKRINLKNV